MYLKKISVALLAAMAVAPAGAVEMLNTQHLWTFDHWAAKGNGTPGFGAEILAFDAANSALWVVGLDVEGPDLGNGGIDVLDLSGNLLNSIDLTALGGVNSVAIANGRAAVAVSAPFKTDPGYVRFFDTSDYSILGTVGVGANPDAVTFTPDGSRVIVANEGEPIDYSAANIDPQGTVSIIDAATLAATTADFTAFDASRVTLEALGVRLNGPNASVSQDLEPEYSAVSADGTRALVTLQENNSVAVIDLETSTVEAIVPLGFKNHNALGNGLDASNSDGIEGNIQNWRVNGTYMPDGIAGFTNDGNQYYVIANEGDAREWGDENDPDFFIDEVRVKDADIDPVLDGLLKLQHGDDYADSANLGRLKVSTTGDLDGDGDLDRLESFGARSFSILNASGEIVYDSADAIEQIIAAQFLDDLWVDDRSDDKGPEPESVVIGQLGASTLLFVGLERSNAVMIWDLTDLGDINFIDMLFADGDIGPEGLTYFTLGNTGYLGIANEISGTTSLYSLTAVPVPAAVWLFGSALAGLGAMRRRDPLA
ncbi:MAG: choice-of-anchor I family protein [Gammaproteobacteria bacterium]|nr:choice-of-anchor I family protein [Gammaproteobacteria bacterium]